MIVAVATEGDEDIKQHADHVIYIPKVRDAFSAITASVPLQLFARAIAIERGCDVDQPRNLAKSVTVESGSGVLMPARKEETVRAVEDAAAVSLPIDGAVGLGVDIVEIARMKKILERTPSFARKVFSCEECCYCEDTAAPEVHFATRFAAKEAVVKALGTGFTRGIGVRDIEVKRSSKGRPYVVLSGRAKQVAKELGVRELPISLSYTHTDAVACALAITEDSQKTAEERVESESRAREALQGSALDA